MTEEELFPKGRPCWVCNLHNGLTLAEQDEHILRHITEGTWPNAAVQMAMAALARAVRKLQEPVVAVDPATLFPPTEDLPQEAAPALAKAGKK